LQGGPKILGQIYQKAGNELYFVFRVLIGFLFALHGSQKLFGAFTDMGPVELGSLFWFAGIIEFFGGIAIALGILARLAASITTVEMLVAYFMVHFPNLVFPIERGGGETVLLFIAAFLVILIYGSGKWGLERLIARREVF
jgi:putative oxidoreductase